MVYTGFYIETFISKVQSSFIIILVFLDSTRPKLMFPIENSTGEFFSLSQILQNRVLPEVLSHAGYNDWIRRGISRKVNPLNGPDSCWTVWSYCPKPLKDQSHACNRKEKGAFFKGYFHLLHHFYRTIFKRDDTVNGIGQQSSKQCSICLLKKITLNKVKAEFFFYGKHTVPWLM